MRATQRRRVVGGRFGVEHVTFEDISQVEEDNPDFAVRLAGAGVAGLYAQVARHLPGDRLSWRVFMEPLLLEDREHPHDPPVMVWTPDRQD